MDATCAIQNSIHVFSLVHINMCPGFWVHIRKDPNRSGRFYEMSEKNIVCRVTSLSVAKMGSLAAQPVLQCELEYAECRVNSEQNNTLQACHPAFDERRNR